MNMPKGVTHHRDLTPKEHETLIQGRCSFCNCDSHWLEGPHGGLCVNIECGRCGARYNVGPCQYAELIREPDPEKLAAIPPPPPPPPSLLQRLGKLLRALSNKRAT